MKNKMKSYAGLFLFLLFFPTSCESSCRGYLPTVFFLRNQSGHTVSIVHKPSCIQLPDSLVLKDGEGFQITGESHGKIDFSSKNFETQLIYYDGRYSIDLNNLPETRRLQNAALYNIYDQDGNYAFILTPEDYDYAAEHGTDLGPEKQLSMPTIREAE